MMNAVVLHTECSVLPSIPKACRPNKLSLHYRIPVDVHEELE